MVASNLVPSVTDFSKAATSPGPNQTIIVRRISFVEDAPAGALLLRQFDQPRRMVAIELTSDLAELPEARFGETTDPFDVVIVPSDLDGGSSRQAMAWMAQSPQLGPGPPISIELKSVATIEWRPGQAIIRGAVDDTDDILAALIDFAFFEGELRSLEKIVESHETQARDDVSRAHRISRRDRAHWTRIGETIELLTQARLTFARLEPLFAKPARTLSPVGRRLMRQLSAKADAASRVAVLTGRLEALEDLYEGANDRINDFRGWHNGQVLEIVIVVLLLIEIILMSGDMYFHYLEFQHEKAAAEADSNQFKHSL